MLFPFVRVMTKMWKKKKKHMRPIISKFSFVIFTYNLAVIFFFSKKLKENARLTIKFINFDKYLVLWREIGSLWDAHTYLILEDV